MAARRPCSYYGLTTALVLFLSLGTVREVSGQFHFCETFLTITQSPGYPYYQLTANITVEYGYIDDLNCEPVWPNPDPATFTFTVNGADVTSNFSVGVNQATGSITLADDVWNLLVASIDGNDTNGDPRTETDLRNVLADGTPKPNVYTSPYNFDHQVLSRCEVSCFAATYSQSTVPYITFNSPRNVTLVYHGDRVSPRPFIHVNVSHVAGATYTPTEFWLEAKINGAYVTFLNGETKLQFAYSSQIVRLAGQIDVAAYATGVYPLDIIVTSQYTNKNETTSIPTKLVVVNENTSQVARGWTIAGVPRLYPQSDGSILMTEGDGSAIYFNKACGNCSFTTPIGEFRLLAVNGTGWVLNSPDSTKVYFNSAGRDTMVADRFGNQVKFTYDGSNRLWKVRDQLGRYTILGYASSYGLDSISDPMGRVTFVRVNADSTLRAIKDPDGDSTRFTYDASKRLSSIVNRRGAVTQLVYRSPSWKLDTLILPAVPINGGASESPKTAFNPWQIVGVPTASTAGTPYTPVVASTVSGSVRDPEGHTTSFTVDRWGQSLVTTDPLNRTTSVTRDANGLVLTVAHPWGATEGVLRNANGQITVHSATGQADTYTAYGAYAQPDSIWGPNQAKRRFYIGINGRIDSVRIGGLTSLKYWYLYDTQGRVLRTIDPEGHQYINHYNSTWGNLDSTLAPGDRYTRKRFDRYGRDSATNVITQPWRRVLYDSLNRATKLYDGVNANPTILTYNQLQLIRVQDPKGQVYRFAYDTLGRMTKRFDAADTTLYQAYRYDRDGLMTGWTNRRAQALSYSYDVLHRMLSKTGDTLYTMPDSFAYSTNGRMIAAWNGVARDSAFLNAALWRDSVVTRIAGQRFRIRYHANSVGELDSTVITNTAGISFVTRRYYRNGQSQRLDSIGLNTSRTKLTRNNDGLRTSIQLPTSPGVTLVRAFTSLHGRYNDSLTHATLNTNLGHGYGFDDPDRIGRETNAARDRGREFTYDGLSRLTRVDFVRYNTNSLFKCTVDPNDGWQCPYITSTDSSRTYAYDQVGNRTDNSGSYRAGNRIDGFGGVTFSHDLDGNRTLSAPPPGFYGEWAYIWSAEGRLTRVIRSSGFVEDYRHDYGYDPYGRLSRIRKDNASYRYLLWDGDHLLAELDSSGTKRVAEYAYHPGVDRPLALITGATTPTLVRYYHQDELANVTAVLRDTVRDQQLVYDAWGLQEAVTGALADTNRLRWKGMFWESGSGLYYARNRWYEPWTGRFMSEDPVGLSGGLNSYAFADGNPVSFRDPYGLDEVTTAECNEEEIKELGLGITCEDLEKLEEEVNNLIDFVDLLLVIHQMPEWSLAEAQNAWLIAQLGDPGPFQAFAGVDARLRNLPTYINVNFVSLGTQFGAVLEGRWVLSNFFTILGHEVATYNLYQGYWDGISVHGTMSVSPFGSTAIFSGYVFRGWLPGPRDGLDPAWGNY